MTLTSEERLGKSKRLKEAEDVLHKLVLGQSVVEMESDGKKMRFTQTNKKNLQNYINQLRKELGKSAVSGRGSLIYRC